MKIGLFLLSLVFATFALKDDECEVCVKTVERFASSLDEETKKDPKLIEDEFKKFCKVSKNKEHRFVSFSYYLF